MANIRKAWENRWLRAGLSLILFFGGMVLLDTGLRLIYDFTRDSALPDTWRTPFTLGWAVCVTALTALLPRRGRQVAMVLLGLLFAVLTLAHGVLFQIFGKFFSFSDLSYAGEGARFFSWSYFKLRKAFLLCVAASFGLMVLAAVLTPKSTGGWRGWLLRLGALIVAVGAMVFLGRVQAPLLPQADTMWWGSTYDPNAPELVYQSFSDPNRCMNMVGLYQYTFRDFATAYNIGADRKTDQALDEYFEAREVSWENEMTGLFAGKSFIMVMMESIDTWLLTPEYMPNLYALQQQGLDFTHHYTPLYLTAGTFCTEIVSQTGLIPTASGLPSSAYATNAFPLSLAHVFREAGYTANSFHSAVPSIYSRGPIHQNLGFAAYHSYADMGMDDYMLDSQMVRAYDQIVPEGQFFSYIITYSGHGPYTEEMSNISDPHLEAARAAVARSGVTGSEENMEEYTLAVAHAMETDAFVGALIEALEADGRLENTVLLFYADHYGKYMTDKEFLNQIKGVTSGSPELYRTPCFFYAEGVEPQKVEKYVSAVDLAPTIVNLFGLDVDCRYYMGDDIFGQLGGVVMLPSYAWYDGQVYSGEAGLELTEEMQQRSAQVRARMETSFDVLKTDYFADKTIP